MYLFCIIIYYFTFYPNIINWYIYIICLIFLHLMLNAILYNHCGYGTTQSKHYCCRINYNYKAVIWFFPIFTTTNSVNFLLIIASLDGMIQDTVHSFRCGHVTYRVMFRCGCSQRGCWVFATTGYRCTCPFSAPWRSWRTTTCSSRGRSWRGKKMIINLQVKSTMTTSRVFIFIYTLFVALEWYLEDTSRTTFL